MQIHDIYRYFSYYRYHGYLGNREDFSWKLMLGIFAKICWHDPMSDKNGQKLRSFYMKTSAHLLLLQLRSLPSLLGLPITNVVTTVTFATKFTNAVDMVTRTRRTFCAFFRIPYCVTKPRVFAAPPSSSMCLRMNSSFLSRNYSVY